MKNRDLQLKPYPTTAELYALERAAREARATEMARLLSAAFDRVKSFFATPAEKGLKHA